MRNLINRINQGFPKGPLVNYSRDYNFYVDFNEASIPFDKVSGQHMQTTGLAGGRVSYHGGPYGINEPAVDKNGLFGCGAFENHITSPCDLDTTDWTKSVFTDSGETTTTPDGDIVKWWEMGEGFVYQEILFNVDAIYSYGFWAKADKPITIGVRKAGQDSGSAYYVPVTLTTEWQFFSSSNVASLSNAKFLLDNRTTSGFSGVSCKIAITKIRMYEAEFLYPYVDGVSPENFSDADQGYKLPINEMPRLLDTLDGAVDGDELLIPVSSKSTSAITNKTETTFDFENTSGAAQGHLIPDIFTVGEYYDVSFNVAFTEPGQLDIYVGQESISTITSDSEVTARAVCSVDGTLRFVTKSLGVAGTVTVNHVKQISPAQGKLTVKWRPMFSYDQATSSNLNITSTTNTIMSLCYSTNTGSVRANDSTTIVSSNTGYQAATEYTVTLQYGPHPGYADALKMQLTITDGTTTWQSSIVDFDGSFNPTDYLSFFFDSEYPQYIKHVSSAKEPGWVV